MRKYKIPVAGTGYVGLSIATLLSQHHQVTAVDIVSEKVDMINNRKSPIQDDYIEKYFEKYPGIKKFMEEDGQVNLAISLHAPNDKLRNEIMPINKAYNIKVLLDACKKYIDKLELKEMDLMGYSEKITGKIPKIYLSIPGMYSMRQK